MNLFFSPKLLVAATLAAAALGAATVAEARPDVYFSIDLQDGPAWVEQAPVYVQPARVYLRPPVFVSPDEVFERQSWRGYEARDGWERERAWRRAERLRHDPYDGFRGGERDHDERGQYRGHRD